MNHIACFDSAARRFGSHRLFRDFSFSIKKGEVVGLLGASGSGKSTLLKIMAGLQNVDSGVFSCRAQRTGFVFQEPRLIPWRSALENVMIPVLDERGRARSRDDALSLIESLGLAGVEHKYPSRLSGGMKQRVSLARALVVEPDLLLLDEPLNALNSELRSSVLNRLKKIHSSRGFSLVYATHFPEEISGFADRILELTADGIILINNCRI